MSYIFLHGVFKFLSKSDVRIVWRMIYLLNAVVAMSERVR